MKRTLLIVAGLALLAGLSFGDVIETRAYAFDRITGTTAETVKLGELCWGAKSVRFTLVGDSCTDSVSRIKVTYIYGGGLNDCGYFFTAVTLIDSIVAAADWNRANLADSLPHYVCDYPDVRVIAVNTHAAWSTKNCTLYVLVRK